MSILIARIRRQNLNQNLDEDEIWLSLMFSYKHPPDNIIPGFIGKIYVIASSIRYSQLDIKRWYSASADLPGNQL